jgi:hypothetical protein
MEEGVMIERNGDDFELICDHCEDSVDGFDEFDDAVQYKKDYGWKSVKGESGEWYELCPQCSTPEIIREYRDK